jgi:hypothetical protein
VHIPIVPDSLVDLLDAPVPFIVGLTSAPSKQNYSKDNKEFVVVDLDNDKITTKDTLCQLPQLKELYAHRTDHITPAAPHGKHLMTMLDPISR